MAKTTIKSGAIVRAPAARLHLVPVEEEEQTTLHLIPVEDAMSRRELANMGVTEKTTAKQRETITSAIRRKISKQLFEPSVTDFSMAGQITKAAFPEAVEKVAEYRKQVLGALSKGGMKLGQAMLELPKHASFLIGNLMELGPSGERRTAEETFKGMVGTKAAKVHARFIEQHKQGQEAILKAHPEWETDPPENFLDLLTSPRKLSLAVAESTPMLIGAGILTAAGQPNLSMAMIYSTEGQGARDEAIESGATEEQADYVYHTYGAVAAVIEQKLRLEPTIRLTGQAYRKVLNRATQQTLKKGSGRVTKEIVLPIIGEVIEEPLQGTWQEVQAKSVYGKEIPGGIGDFIDRRAQEALIALVMSAAPIAGGVGIARVQRAKKGTRAAARQKQAEQIIKQIQQKETLIGSAIRLKSGEMLTGTTHANILREVAATGRKISNEEFDIPGGSGFVTNEGRFVSPRQGWDIAEKAGQLKLTGEDSMAEEFIEKKHLIAEGIVFRAPLATPEKLADIQKRLDMAFGKNDVAAFASIITDQLAPLAPSFEKNSMQGMAETLLMEMRERRAAEAPPTVPPGAPQPPPTAITSPEAVSVAPTPEIPPTEAPKPRRIVAQPEKVTQQQKEIGETFGLTESDVLARLQKAEKRYIDLKSKPEKDLTPSQKKELDFLVRKRDDVQALLGRDIKPLTRPAVEKRAEQYGIPYVGRTTRAVLKDIVARAEEQRAKKEITGWKEWSKGEPIDVTPNKLLKFALQHEARGARVGYRAGQIDLTASHEELLDFAKENLPPGEHKLVVKAAEKAVKARTPAELKKVVEAVNRMVANYEKASAIAEVKAAIKSAKKAKLRPEFQEAVDEITEEFSLSTPRKKTLERMERLLEAAEREEHQIGDIPQDLINRAREILADVDKPTLKDFTVDELHTVTAAIGNLINQNILKNELLFSQKYRTLKTTVVSATKAVTKRWGKKFTTPVGKFEDKAKLNKAWSAAKRLAGWDQLNLGTKANMLGGRGNVADDLLFKGLKRGTRGTIELQLDGLDHLLSTLDRLDVDQKTLTRWSHILGEKKVKPVTVILPEARGEDGRRVGTMEITVAERIHFLRFIKDPDNRAAMLADQNKGITFRRDPTQKAIKLTAKDMKAIIDSASSAEQEVAQAMHDYINGRAGKLNIKQQVGDIWLKLMGFPLIQKPDYVHRERAGEHREFDPTKTINDYVTQWLERMGIFKPRARSNAPFIIGDAFAEFNADINRMSAFAGKALAVNDAMQLLRDRGFRTSVKEGFKHGDALLKDLEQSIRFYQGLDRPTQGDIETLGKIILRKAHVGALAVKPHIVLYQTVSLLNAVASDMNAARLYNPKHYRLSELRRMRKILNEFSPELDARERGGSYQLMTPAAAGPTLRAMYGIEGKKLKSIHRADSVVMEILGLAAEEEGKAKDFKGNELNEYIARRVENIVDETQPSWDAATLSSLAREGRAGFFKHMLVMFSSQRNKNVNIVVNSVVDYMFSKHTKADKATLAKKVTIPTIVNATLIYAIGTAYWYGLKSIARLFGFRPKEDDDWKTHITGILGRMFGNWLIVGDLVNSGIINAIKGVGGTPAMFKRSRGTIMGEAIGQAMEAIIELTKFASELFKNEKYGERSPKAGEAKAFYTFWRLVEKAGKSAGIFTGLPFQGILQIAAPFMPQRQEPEKKSKGSSGTGF